MRNRRLLWMPVLLLAITASAQTPTADYPSGTDWSIVKRPAGSIVAGAMHVDDDEVDIPLGAFNNKFLKTVPARGSVDTLIYSGPPSTSTIANFESMQSQLIAKGYKQIFACVRQACGGYAFPSAFSETTHAAVEGQQGGGPYAVLITEAMGATSDDVRYAAFQQGNEFLCLLTTLNPGKYSGVMLLDVGGHRAGGPGLKSND